MYVNFRNGLVFFFKHKAPIKGFNLVACLIDRLMALAAVETVHVGVFQLFCILLAACFRGLKQTAVVRGAQRYCYMCTNRGYPCSLGSPTPNLRLHQTEWCECYWHECC